MSDAKRRKPYGHWDSLITPASMAGGVRLADCAWAADGTLLWLEGRGDKSVLVMQPPDSSEPRDVDTGCDVRARVGYGGGDFSTGGNHIYFSAAEFGAHFAPGLAGWSCSSHHAGIRAGGCAKAICG